MSSGIKKTTFGFVDVLDAFVVVAAAGLSVAGLADVDSMVVVGLSVAGLSVAGLSVAGLADVASKMASSAMFRPEFEPFWS